MKIYKYEIFEKIVGFNISYSANIRNQFKNDDIPEKPI